MRTRSGTKAGQVQLERRRLEADDVEGVLVVDFGCLCVAADAIFIGFPGHLLKTERVVSYE